MFKRFGWLAILLAGCGGAASSSSDDPTTPPVPVPVVMTGLQISPGSGTYDLADTFDLAVVGLKSDGTQIPVDATWTLSDPSVVGLSDPTGVFTTVAFLKAGTCDVHAAFGGFTAHITLTAERIFPADPGSVYGVGQGGLRSWTVGAGAPATLAAASIYGVTQNLAGDNVYTMTNNTVNRTDAATGATSPLATLPSAAFLYFSLDVDSQDRIYTVNGGGAVVRIDPTTGATTSLGTTAQYQNTMAVGPDDRVYTVSLYAMGSLPTISRFNPATGTRSTWSTMSDQITGSGGLYCNAGFAINARGEGFLGEMSGDSIYRHVDVNGDGDARDVGEVSRFATLPCGWGVGSTQMFGTCVATGGSVMVNVDAATTGGVTGIYWLTDRNDNGNCDDPDEVTLFNPNRVNNGTCSSCLSARK